MTRIIAKGAARSRTEPEPAARHAPMPVLRLRRMGASAELIDHLAQMWAGMDDEGADAAAEAMEAMSDRDLLVTLVGLPDADDPAAWAEANPFPDDARRLVAMEG